MNDLLAAMLSWATTLSGHPAPDVSAQTVSVSPAAVVQRAPGGREGNSHRAERTIAHEVDFGVTARACPANVAAREDRDHVEAHARMPRQRRRARAARAAARAIRRCLRASTDSAAEPNARARAQPHLDEDQRRRGRARRDRAPRAEGVRCARRCGSRAASRWRAASASPYAPRARVWRARGPRRTIGHGGASSAG